MKIHLGRRLVIERLMWTLLVIKLEIPCQCLAGFAWRSIIVRVDFFILDRTPHPFCKNIIQGSPFAIHADLNVCIEQELAILRAGKMAALIAIANQRHRLSQGPLDGGEHKG